MATLRQKLSTYAITISTHRKQPHFAQREPAELFIATLFRYHDAGKFHLHAFAVMPDHVHILMTPALDQSTARCVQLIKGGYSFAARTQGKEEIWHSGYFEHRVRDEADFDAQSRYIAANPSRKGLANYPHVHTAEPHAQRLAPYFISCTGTPAGIFSSN